MLGRMLNKLQSRIDIRLLQARKAEVIGDLSDVTRHGQVAAAGLLDSLFLKNRIS